jgi:glycosyltransferase involved in cell wall biosynthesis
VFRPCVIVPVYNHGFAVRGVVSGVVAQKLPCLLVDDGSSPEYAKILDALVTASGPRVTLIRHTVNRGKGAAVLTGVRWALRGGYTHAVQIDADGQHRTSDIPRFLEQAVAHPQAVIVGCPQYDQTVPWLRYYARYLTHIWVWINTLSLEIKDSMCGFRVYPVPAIIALDARRKFGERMSFDIEVLVRLYWDGVPIINLPTPVRYWRNGVSHFRGFDNVLISRAHAALFFGMLLRAPKLIARRWSAR